MSQLAMPESKTPSTRRSGSRFILWALAWALIVATFTASPAWSQRELYWQELAVEARLDEQGVLHVRENHTMVMTGDWNGGERTFRPRMPGTVTVGGVTRIDEMEREAQLDRGDLAVVDHWDWAGDNTIRWRSRLPSDPIFDQTELRYRIDYQMTHVLERRGDAYYLDHDFAFPDRAGDIERFELELELAPEWQTAEGRVLRHSAEHLRPGVTHVVYLELHPVGDTVPAAVLEAPSPWLWRVVSAVGALLVLGFSVGFWRREAATGRMAPGDSLEQVDEAWLEERVLSSRPEVIGAVWDEVTGSPEVAATIARLVVEGKLATATERRGLFRRTVLKLERNVHIAEFASHDRSLMRALFFNQRKRVDTDKIRKHYAKRGFKPVEKIRHTLDVAVKRQLPQRELVGQPHYLKGRWYWLVGLLFALIALVTKPGPISVDAGDATVLHLGRTTGVVALALIALGAGTIFASALRSRVVAAGRTLWTLPCLAMLVLVLLAWFQFSPAALMNSPVSLLAGALATLAVCVGNALAWMNTARTPLSEVGVARRRELELARRWFKRELRRPDPRLSDEWFPYLVGLGLGGDVDRWFSSFGGSVSGSSVSRLPSSSSSTSWGGGSTWTGGGGRFGGAGATAVWAAAATAVGSGVSKPSSGSSGGGGGGGSSGGGGGGGW